MFALVGVDGPWLDHAAAAASNAAGFLNAYRVADAERAVLLIDVEDETAGRDGRVLDSVEHSAQRHSVQLFNQVFPSTGVLLRDREFLT